MRKPGCPSPPFQGPWGPGRTLQNQEDQLVKQAGALGFSQANAKHFPNMLKSNKMLKRNQVSRNKIPPNPFNFLCPVPPPEVLSSSLQFEKQPLEAVFFPVPFQQIFLQEKKKEKKFKIMLHIFNNKNAVQKM